PGSLHPHAGRRRDVHRRRGPEVRAHRPRAGPTGRDPGQCDGRGPGLLQGSSVRSDTHSGGAPHRPPAPLPAGVPRPRRRLLYAHTTTLVSGPLRRGWYPRRRALRRGRIVSFGTEFASAAVPEWGLLWSDEARSAEDESSGEFLKPPGGGGRLTGEQ